MARRFTRGVVALAGFLIPASARADPGEVESIALHYETTGACPSESEFIATVRKYTTRWSRVPEGSPAVRTLRVRISAATSPVVGKLVVASGGGTVSERALEGPTCKRVSDGLAVMVALAIDSPGDGPSPEPPSRVQEGGATILEPNLPKGQRQPELPVTRQSPASATAPRRAGERAEFSLDFRVETTAAVLRGAMPGVGASLKIAPASSASWLGTWKPSVGLGVRQSFPKERTLRGGSAEFFWTVADLRLCPLRFALGGAVELSPCAEMDVGVLHATAHGFADANPLSSFWLDIGGSLWAAVNLSKRVFLSSTVLMTVPVNRRPFVLSSGAPIANVPPIGVLYGLGAGVRL